MSRSPPRPRLRFNDGRPPPPDYLPAAGGGYFSELAFRGYFNGGGFGRTDAWRNPLPLGSPRERRELEKQRIREEIIAREMQWRGELENEVRRELALERELALRRPPPDREEREFALRRPPPDREECEFALRRPPPDHGEREFALRRPPPDREECEFALRRPPPDREERELALRRPPPDREECGFALRRTPPDREEREFALRRPLPDRVSFPTSSFSPPLPLERRFPPTHLRDTLLREQFMLPDRAAEVGAFQRLPEERRRQELSGYGSRPIIEVGRRSVPFEDMSTPRPSTSGVKRKSASPALAPAGAGSKFDSPKKLQKEWSCALCKVTATSMQAFNDHLGGKKHRAKEAELKGSKSGSSTKKEPIDGTPSPVGGENTVITLQDSQRAKRLKKTKQVGGGSGDQYAKKKIKSGHAAKKKVSLFCEYCHVECYSEIVMAAHYKGKKHQTRMNQLRKFLPKSSNGSRVAEGYEREDATGAVTDEADDDAMLELGWYENEDKTSEVGEKEIDGKVEEGLVNEDYKA